MPLRRRSRDLLLIVTFFLASSPLYLLTAIFPSSDVYLIFREASNELQTGEFFVTADAEEGRSLLVDQYVGTDGVYRTPYEIGGLVLFSGAMRIGRAAFAVLPGEGQTPAALDGFVIACLFILLVQLSLAALFILLRLLGIGSRTAAITTALALFGGTFWFFSKPYFRDSLLLLPTILSFIGLCQVTRAVSDRAKIGWAFMTGVVAAAGITLKIAFSLTVAGLGVGFLTYLVAERRKLRIGTVAAGLAAFTGPLVLGLWLVFRANIARHGVALPQGDLLAERGFLLNGYNLLLSPGNGILIYNPVILLAVPGAYFLYKSHKSFALGVSCFTILTYLFYGSLAEGIGWMSYGARLMLSAILMLFVPVGFAIDRLRKKGRIGVALLGIAGFLIWLPGLVLEKNIWLSPAAEVVPKEHVLNSFAANPIRMHWTILAGRLSDGTVDSTPVQHIPIEDETGEHVIVTVPRWGYYSDVLWYSLRDPHRNLFWTVQVGLVAISMVFVLLLWRLITSIDPVRCGKSFVCHMSTDNDAASKATVP